MFQTGCECAELQLCGQGTASACCNPGPVGCTVCSLLQCSSPCVAASPSNMSHNHHILLQQFRPRRALIFPEPPPQVPAASATTQIVHQIPDKAAKCAVLPTRRPVSCSAPGRCGSASRAGVPKPQGMTRCSRILWNRWQNMSSVSRHMPWKTVRARALWLANRSPGQARKAGAWELGCRWMSNNRRGPKTPQQPQRQDSKVCRRAWLPLAQQRGACAGRAVPGWPVGSPAPHPGSS